MPAKVTPESAAAYEDWGSRKPADWKRVEEEVAGWGDLQPKAKPKKRALGDKPGHPFYGNQHTDGGYSAFEEKALAGIQGMSRTAKGVSDTSTSTDKQKLKVEEGEKLAAKTSENVKGALRMAFNAKDEEFVDADEVHRFTEGLARKVSEDLLPEGQGLYRTWETPNKQTTPSKIKAETREFTSQLYEKLKAKEDPIQTAAWAERQMANIHPWADGVGRTTKVLSAFILARGGAGLPKYPSSKSYYSEIKKSPESWEKFYRSMIADD